MEIAIGVLVGLIGGGITVAGRAVLKWHRRARLQASLITPAVGRVAPGVLAIILAISNDGKTVLNNATVRVDLPTNLGPVPAGGAKERMREVRNGEEWTVFHVDSDRPLRPGQWEIELFEFASPRAGVWEIPVRLHSNEMLQADFTVRLDIGRSDGAHPEPASSD